MICVMQRKWRRKERKTHHRESGAVNSHGGGKEQRTMICSRCGGVMISEDFSNITNEVAPWFYAGWRCLYCGDIIDPLILRHRRQMVEPLQQPLLGARRRAA
jgi:chromosome condensin MukBEF ATPase and DNA-binding subunit MukB